MGLARVLHKWSSTDGGEQEPTKEKADENTQQLNKLQERCH